MSQYFGLITSADPNSSYSSRKSFPINKFGYIPKSDTFQHLTVSDKFNEKKDKPNVYEIANQAIVDPGETSRFYVPAQSLYVKFHLYQHEALQDSVEPQGTYQICLPKALPGLKMKVVFTANLKMKGYPTTLQEPWKGRGWPVYDTLNDPDYEDIEQYDHKRIRLNSQKIEVKCNDSDLLRGHYFFPVVTYLDSPNPTAATNRESTDTIMSTLPFGLGGSMLIDVIPERTTMEQILASHAELECIVAGQWIAKFYGIWSPPA